MPDEEGTELSDRNAAILMAKRSLGEMLCEDIRADGALHGRCIVIADEHGTTVAEVCAEEIYVRKRDQSSSSSPLHQSEPQVA